MEAAPEQGNADQQKSNVEPNVEVQPVQAKEEKFSNYADWLKDDFKKLFGQLKLTELQKHFLRSRWLDQVIWMEGRAAHNRNWYYRLRLITIIGGVIVPILVSLDIGEIQKNRSLKIATVVLSGVVAGSAAVEEFFHFGERWYHYRRTVESLKTEGWQFFELSGPYREYQQQDQGHQEAFVTFAEQVEEIMESDVAYYVTQMSQQKSKQGQAQIKSGGTNQV
ncbi:MAG: DUF4231 domain-containing protein [Cyanothece sp. SIO1E1]|nr:DUF4231 domain-containing protein [Cyanothece sp. SIO1E1]